MSSGASQARAALHAPFRPRRSRRVALTLAVAQAVLLCAIAVAAPGGRFGWTDRLGIVGCAVVVAWATWRFAAVALLPREDGLSVRNYLLRRELVWAEVVNVRFGGGGPWVILDLDDGDTLAVMAIQRSDGAFAESEARRLATLVALHTPTPRET